MSSKVIDAVDKTIRDSFNANLDGVSFGVAPVTLALNLDYSLMMRANRLSLLASGNFAGKVGDALDRSKNNKTHLVYWAIQA